MSVIIMVGLFSVAIQMTPITHQDRIIKKSGYGVLLMLMGIQHADFHDKMYHQEK